MRGLTLQILSAFVLSLLVASVARAEHFAMLSRLKGFEGRDLNVAIVVPDIPGVDRYNSAEREFAHQLLRNAQETVKARMVAFYSRLHPEKPRAEFEDFFESLFNDNPMGDQNSGTVVIFDDAGQVLATMRAAWSQQHPSEQHFGSAIDRPPLEFKPYVSGENLWEGRALSTSEAWTGADIELKNLYKAEGLPKSYVSLLFYIAEKAGLTDRAIETPVPAARVMPASQALSFPPDSKVNWLVFPERYSFTCFEDMIPTYKEYGFEIMRAEPGAKGVYWMGASRSQYLNTVLAGFHGKSTYRISESSWDHSAYDTLLRTGTLVEMLKHFRLKKYLPRFADCAQLLTESQAEPAFTAELKLPELPPGVKVTVTTSVHYSPPIMERLIRQMQPGYIKSTTRFKK